MSIALEDIGLGKIKTRDGRYSYQLRQEDLLWLARSLQGESRSESGRKAVMWCYAQRMASRNLTSLKKLVKAHSQPINPKWRLVAAEPISVDPTEGPPNLGSKVTPGNDNSSEERLRRRADLSTKDWNAIDLSIRRLVKDFSEKRVSNPVPKAVDFATPAAASQRASAAREGNRFSGTTPQQALEIRGLVLVYDDRGRGPEATANDGNAFYAESRRPNPSAEWPENYVYIEYNGEESEEEPFEQGQETGDATNPLSGGSQNAVNLNDEEVVERIEILTQGRTGAPTDVRYGYFHSSGSTDEQSSLGPYKNESSLLDPYDKFYNQMIAFSNLSTLDASSGVPVLGIFTFDEEENLINLNERIFTASPLEDYTETGFYSDRPLASLVDFTVTLQQPSVGGPSAIVVGKLTVKIHNPYALNRSHKSYNDKGKFLDWMFRQGIYLRIKYGMSGNEQTTDALKIRDEDFFIAQHDITFENNLEVVVVYTLMPAAYKLFNQINIGESIPVESTNLTNEVIQNAIQTTLSNDETNQAFADNSSLAQYINDIKTNLIQFQTDFNSEREFVGSDTYKRSDGTFGSILRGAATNLEIINSPDGFDPILVRNTIEALKTIQQNLLMTRLNEVIRRNSYLKTVRTSLNYIAINLGPIFHELATPEILKIANIASRTGLRFSEDESRNQKRNKVSIVFGNFNANAGDWANKSISTFPVNVDDILSHLRQNRDLGKFFDTFNGFVGFLFNQTKKRDVYSPQVTVVNGRRIAPLEVPEIKYTFYPDPADDNNWIFYIYDTKSYVVDIYNLLREIGENLSEDDIFVKCSEKRVPILKPGSNSHFMKNLNASTKGDDVIQSNNMFQANQSFNQRNIDGSNLRPGVDANFLTNNAFEGSINQDVFRATELIMPLKVDLEHMMISDAPLFSHVYLFFPGIKSFSGLYTIYELTHTVNKSEAKTSMVLQIQLSQRNPVPNS